MALTLVNKKYKAILFSQLNFHYNCGSYLGELCGVKYDIFSSEVLSWVKVQWRGGGNGHFLHFESEWICRAYSRLKIYQKPWLTTQKEGCKAQQRHVRSHCLEQSLLFHSWPGSLDFLSHLSSPPLPVRPSRLKISEVSSKIMMMDHLSLHNIQEYLSNLI